MLVVGGRPLRFAFTSEISGLTSVFQFGTDEIARGEFHCGNRSGTCIARRPTPAERWPAAEMLYREVLPRATFRNLSRGGA